MWVNGNKTFSFMLQPLYPPQRGVPGTYQIGGYVSQRGGLNMAVLPQVRNQTSFVWSTGYMSGHYMWFRHIDKDRNSCLCCPVHNQSHIDWAVPVHCFMMCCQDKELQINKLCGFRQQANYRTKQRLQEIKMIILTCSIWASPLALNLSVSLPVP